MSLPGGRQVDGWATARATVRATARLSFAVAALAARTVAETARRGDPGAATTEALGRLTAALEERMGGVLRGTFEAGSRWLSDRTADRRDSR